MVNFYFNNTVMKVDHRFSRMLKINNKKPEYVI